MIKFNKKTYLAIIAILALTSCAKEEPMVISEITHNPENGIVIAQSEFVGKRYATHTNKSTSDCEDGIGIGVMVKTTVEDASYIFNKSQQPCKQAEVMFDGDLPKYSKAADPSIDIIFNDKYGKLSQNHALEKGAFASTLFTDLDNGGYIASSLANTQYDEMGLLKVDYEALEFESKDNRKQDKFEEILKEDELYGQEVAMAKLREEARAEKELLAKANKMVEDKNAELTVKARENSEYAWALSQNLVKKSEEIDELKNQVYGLQAANEVQTNSYEKKLRLLEQRVEDFAQLSLELKRENQRLANNLKQANTTLSKDLNATEEDAENLRYIAMLQAAGEISADETFADALKYSQQKALYRKAERLQTQADALAYHANADKTFNKDVSQAYKELQAKTEPAFKGKLARVVGVDINKEATFDDVDLLLKESDRSLNDILAEILADVQPMLGSWKVDWKLASQNLEIRDEKWNVTAEISFNEFLDYIKQQVKDIHGVDLTIELYEETRRIVIADNL